MWKYMCGHLTGNGGYPLFSHGPFLFNLEIDPSESYNLIETYPDVAKRFAEILDSWDEEMDANLRGWI